MWWKFLFQIFSMGYELEMGAPENRPSKESLRHNDGSHNMLPDPVINAWRERIQSCCNDEKKELPNPEEPQS